MVVNGGVLRDVADGDHLSKSDIAGFSGFKASGPAVRGPGSFSRYRAHSRRQGRKARTADGVEGVSLRGGNPRAGRVLGSVTGWVWKYVIGDGTSRKIWTRRRVH